MTTFPSTARHGRLISQLTDAALAVVLPAGARRNSVDMELALGQSIDARLRHEHRRPAPASRDDLVSRLAQAAYRAALGAGVRGSFLAVELGLWAAFRDVIGRQENRPLLDDF